ncbi:MAG: recombination mediator RecR [Alphaproteobacteria bacterium]
MAKTLPDELDVLVRLVSRLPGLGPRSARRAVLHMLTRRQALMQPLAEALAHAAEAIIPCETCGNLSTTSPCDICSDSKRATAKRLCVVEQVADLWALERAGVFDGQYHVLGGCLSAIDGVGPEDLSIEQLLSRVQDLQVEEVILALNATTGGQTTAHYLSDRLAPLGVTVTRLAHGVPVGGELDYMDDGTLALALKRRSSAS